MREAAMRRFAYVLCLGVSASIPALPPAFAEDAGRPLFDGYLAKPDAEMEKMKQRSGKPGVQDLRWNHSCNIYYPVRREGAACHAPGVETDGAMVGNACCTTMTAEEKRSESCRKGLNEWVRNARAASGSGLARKRVGLWYSVNQESCAPELNEIASQSGRALPVRGAASTPRASAAIAESLGRRPGSERRPDYVDSGGTNDTAEYLFEILSFALGAATIVASAYQPRVGGYYGTRNPGRAPAYVPVPSGRSYNRGSDITGLGR
jgi:hypothetical protein